MDEVEICSRCGKMVPLRIFGETFICPRCGNSTTLVVKLKDYETVVQRLQAGKHPFEEEAPKKNPGKKKAAKTAKKPAKKTSKKTTKSSKKKKR